MALTVVVCQRTHPPLLTALTYAASNPPWLMGGLIPSGLAGAYPRRDVMITANVGLMVLVAALAREAAPSAPPSRSGSP